MPGRAAGRYVGQWKDGKMHGNGVKTDPHGNLFEGEWKEGKPVVKDGAAITCSTRQRPSFGRLSSTHDHRPDTGGKDPGPMDWLNEAVANVTNVGRNREYYSISTQDQDDHQSRS